MRTALLSALALAALAPMAQAQAQDTTAERYRRWLDLGTQRFERVGNLGRAADSLHEAIRVDPLRPEAYAVLARLHLARREVERAVFCFYEAIKRSPPERAKELLTALRRQRPKAALVEGGAPARLVARYFGQAATDPGGRGGSGSLDAGAQLDARLLLVQVYDAQGRLITGAEPTLTVSEGLRLADGVVSAGERPSRVETIRFALGDATGTSLRLRVIGKLTRLSLRARGEAVGPGEALHISVSASDAAGNRLFHERYEWSARKGETQADALLSSTFSRGHPDFRGEAQRIHVKGPAKPTAEQLGRYRVTCRHAPTGVEATTDFELKAEPVKRPYTWPPFAWSDNLGDALAAARKQGKPVLINFYAEW